MHDEQSCIGLARGRDSRVDCRRRRMCETSEGARVPHALGPAVSIDTQVSSKTEAVRVIPACGGYGEAKMESWESSLGVLYLAVFGVSCGDTGAYGQSVNRECEKGYLALTWVIA